MRLLRNCDNEVYTENTLVSAIIITHNRFELLKRAVRSVYDQTYSNIELIVVDDGSTDETTSWCKNQNFRYIRIPTGQSKGGNYARNLGIKAAKGEYVAFLDDDDYWLPEKTVRQLELFHKYDCELVHGGRRLEIVHENGDIDYSDTFPIPYHWGDMSKLILLTVGTTTSSFILVKRKALLEVGLFDENLRFWQDYELTIRLAQRKPFYFVNFPIGVYRVDNNDKNRLTNRYFEWKKAVRYIHNKHKDLYMHLTTWEKIGYYIRILRDARRRAKCSQLTIRYLILSILCVCSKFYNFINLLVTENIHKFK